VCENDSLPHLHVNLVEDMFAAMYRASGIGWAASQIGGPLRIVTIDVAERGAPRHPRVFINPLLIWQSEQSPVSPEALLERLLKSGADRANL
jgi:peptide deformylase